MRFAPAHQNHAMVSEVGRLAVAGKIGHLQAAEFLGTQTPAVGRLESNRVTPCRQGALAARVEDANDLEICEVEEFLQLTLAKGSFPGPRFRRLRMRHPVQFRHDLGKYPAKQLRALLAPVVVRAA